MSNRKGIILSGGTGSRLHPLTIAVSKQLMPIYDKPTIYYPLATLMQAGIRDILIITTPQDQQHFVNLLKDGDQFGISISYASQSKPNGLAEAYIIADECEFLNGNPSAMILGDNIFHGNEAFINCLDVANESELNTIFAYKVSDPSAYGVVTFDDANKVVSLEEKPINPKSNFAVPGIYFFDQSAPAVAGSLKKSPRGELEIMDMCKAYMNQNRLLVNRVPEGVAWLDSGTHETLIDAAQYVRIIEQRQGHKIACLEEIALQKGWIDKEDVERQINKLGKSTYCDYLKKLI
jgi:glucose-1-phosphate thymidylyltransferase